MQGKLIKKRKKGGDSWNARREKKRKKCRNASIEENMKKEKKLK